MENRCKFPTVSSRLLRIKGNKWQGEKNNLESDIICHLKQQFPAEFHMALCRYLEDCIIDFEQRMFNFLLSFIYYIIVWLLTKKKMCSGSRIKTVNTCTVTSHMNCISNADTIKFWQ